MNIYNQLSEQISKGVDHQVTSTLLQKLNGFQKKDAITIVSNAKVQSNCSQGT